MVIYQKVCPKVFGVPNRFSFRLSSQGYKVISRLALTLVLNLVNASFALLRSKVGIDSDNH